MPPLDDFGDEGPLAPKAPPPYLEPFKNNATVFAGQTAYLQCIVKHVGDKTVRIFKIWLSVLESEEVWAEGARVACVHNNNVVNGARLSRVSN